MTKDQPGNDAQGGVLAAGDGGVSNLRKDAADPGEGHDQG
jgi:hypothetical protein